jgi:DNA-binding transcriptional LysR family regulator
MEAFVRVVDTGSFSSAARQLRVGQPAVSKTIAQIEERLGVRLLLRSTQGLNLTEAGQHFYEHAKRSIEEAEEAYLAAHNAGNALSGRLRIYGPLTFTRLHVIPHLPIFLAKHPALDVEMVLDDRRIDLIEAGIDVALRMGKLANSALTARKIAQSPRFVLATPAYFESVGEPRTPADLVAHQAVIYDYGTAEAQWRFQKGTAEISVTLKGRVRVSAAEGLREAVLSGVGFAIASEWMFAPELRTGAVRPVLQDWTVPPIELRAVFPTGRRATAKAHAFVSFIEAQLSKLADRPEPDSAVPPTTQEAAGFSGWPPLRDPAIRCRRLRHGQ